MRKKLKNNLIVQSLKFKVQSLTAFNFELSALSLILLMVIVTACNPKDSTHDHADTYTCPMHPTVISDKPGVCPVCAMDLVRKGIPGEEVKITEDLAKLINSPNEVVLASVKTAKAEYKSMPVTFSIQGVITYDTRNIYTIPARVGGRLEKVLLKYNYQSVRKGQKVAEIYSTDLVSAQQEFLYLIRNDSGNQILVNAARSKLLLLGATEQQIDELSMSQEVSYTFSVYSPYDGLMISENQATPSAPANAGIARGMNSGSMNKSSAGNTEGTFSNPGPSASSFVRVGSYVSAGQTLFRLVNTNSLWIEFNVPLSQASGIKVGDKLEWVDQNISKQLKIDFVEPFFSEGEDFIKLRSYYKGSDISVGQLVEATIKITTGESLWIPQHALLDLGLDQIVFVKERGLFKPRKVSSGLHAGEWVAITNGLASSDEIAVNAQYLVDSENFIKTSN